MIAALAIDLGTSGVKAAVVARDGRILGTGAAELCFDILPNGGAEQDGEAVWQSVKQASAAAVAMARVPREQIVVACCTSQYSSIVPVDSSGNAIGSMVLYLDGRGGRYTSEIHRRHPEAAASWRKIHGKQPRPSGADSLAHILWIRNERPEIYERAASFLEPMDYVTAKLTGERVATQCTAYMSLLVDNRLSNVTQYDETLLSYAGIDRGKLPHLLPVDAIAGAIRSKIADELGISREAKVAMGANDTHALAMGTATFDGASLGISFGTTSVGVTFASNRPPDDAHFLFTMPAPLKNRYVMAGENGLGAGGLKHILESMIYRDDEFGAHATDDIYVAIDKIVAGTQTGAGGALFLPWLSGSLAPAPDGAARGGFINLSLQTRRTDLVRAVMEGIAFNMRWMIGPAEEFCGRRFEEFRFCGGGALSDAWAQILADVLGRPVHQLDNPRYVNCLGTAMMAFHHIGECDLDTLSRWVSSHAVRAPRAETAEIYNHAFPVFVQAHARMVELCGALNG